MDTPYYSLLSGAMKQFLLSSLLFSSNLKSGIERGGSFAAYYHGKIVAHLWGGYSDYDCRRPWKEDTLSTFFSSTKAVASFVIAHLVDRLVNSGHHKFRLPSKMLLFL